MAESFKTIIYETRGPVGILTLNRPDRLNALAPELVEEVGRCLDAIETDDELRVLILTGAGRAFSAGFDLKEEAGKPWGTVEVVKPILERCFAFITRFWHFPKPTIAAVNGYALAGGCELALCCDMTIMAEEAFLGEPELRFGSGIVALILPWLIGPKKAKEWILTGEDRIDAQQALQWGLVNRIVPRDQLMAASLRLAREIAINDRVKVGMTKQAINRTYSFMGFEAAMRMAHDIDVQIEAYPTEDSKTFRRMMHEDGLKAAIAWRDARFRALEQADKN
jgi:enoyl-CoA hydratase/carnithine racemase